MNPNESDVEPSNVKQGLPVTTASSGWVTASWCAAPVYRALRLRLRGVQLDFVSGGGGSGATAQKEKRPKPPKKNRMKIERERRLR